MEICECSVVTRGEMKWIGFVILWGVRHLSLDLVQKLK